MLYIFIALIGASIGSFINVVSVRLNNGENFISTRSHCPSCGHILIFILEDVVATAIIKLEDVIILLKYSSLYYLFW